MKNTLIIYALRLGIWLIEKLIARISETPAANGKQGADGAKPSERYGEDVVINPDTAKRFADFIKRHTVPEKRETEAEGDGKGEESENA